MSQIKAIMKAYRVKGALDRLELAKTNTLRAMQGLPPIITWYERCYINCLASLKRTLVQAFCPCCAYGALHRIRTHVTESNTWYGRAFTDGSYENDAVKSIAGFVSGILISYILYIVMMFQMDFQPITSIAICVPLATILCLGLAFSFNIRCLVLLMLPQFFSSKGRGFLLMYALILVMNHPIQNLNHNMIVMSQSATCGQEMAYNQTKEIVNAAMAPMLGVLGSLRIVLGKLKQMADTLRKVFLALKKVIEEIAAAIKRAVLWLGTIVDQCNNKMGEPYRKCKSGFARASRDCRYQLGIFQFMCGVVDAVSHVCNIAKVGELFCLLTAHLKELMKSQIGQRVAGAVSNVYHMFYVNITLHYHYNLTVEQSKSYTEVRESIISEIKGHLEVFRQFLVVLHHILLLTFILVFVKALMYRQKYLVDDKFDNRYITLQMLEIDMKRQELNKETIFPLSWKENRKYIKTRLTPLSTAMEESSFKLTPPISSLAPATLCPCWIKQSMHSLNLNFQKTIQMTGAERKKLIRGVILLLAGGFQVMFYMLCDYGLYWMLSMIRRHFAIKVHNAIPAHMKMHVEGDGILSDMYRSLIALFDPISGAQLDIDTTQCLPNPSQPDYRVYKNIAFVYIVCFLLTLTESYGLRLRHVIAGCYFPKRQQARAVWLYNHVIKNRGGLLKFMRRQLRRKYKRDGDVVKASIRGKIVAQFPAVGRVLKAFGFEQKACLSCGAEGKPTDLENFYHCDNHGCTAVYCLDCFTDLNNLCTVCMSPIDYGDLSDCSDERDSSEDEEVVSSRREKSLERRARAEERRRQRRPSGMLSTFKGMMGAPPEPDHDLEKALLSRDEDDYNANSSICATNTYSDSESEYDSDEGLDYTYQYQDKTSVDYHDSDDEFDAENLQCIQSSSAVKLDLVTEDIFDDSFDRISDEYDVESLTLHRLFTSLANDEPAQAIMLRQ